jgi:hypothetical protein
LRKILTDFAGFLDSTRKIEADQLSSSFPNQSGISTPTHSSIQNLFSSKILWQPTGFGMKRSCVHLRTNHFVAIPLNTETLDVRLSSEPGDCTNDRKLMRYSTLAANQLSFMKKQI